MSNYKIIVIQAGWVLAGEVEDCGDSLRVTNGTVIRRWGTTKGLGQLAFNGVTKETVLDDFGVGEVPKSALLFTINCKNPL